MRCASENETEEEQPGRWEERCPEIGQREKEEREDENPSSSFLKIEPAMQGKECPSRERSER